MPKPNQNPLPPLSDNDYAALKASIAESGQMVPIIVSGGPAMKGEVVDGFHRQRACRELKIEPKVVREPFATESDFRLRQIDLNIIRRQLNQVERIKLAMAREPWEKIRAAERAKAGKPLENSRQGSRASAAAAEAAGLKRDTYEHGKFVLEKAPDEIRSRMEAGSVSVDRAYRDTRRALGLDHRAIVKKSVSGRIGEALPGGKFGGIVVAAPWRTQAMRFEKGRLASTELATIDVPAIAAADAVVCLWTSNLWLREAYTVIETWGARPFALVTWVRDNASATETLRDRTMHGILATFGKVPGASRKTNLVLGGDGAGVPGAVYEIVDELAPGTSRISLFGETRKAGWKAWVPDIK